MFALGRSGLTLAVTGAYMHSHCVVMITQNNS